MLQIFKMTNLHLSVNNQIIKYASILPLTSNLKMSDNYDFKEIIVQKL